MAAIWIICEPEHSLIQHLIGNHTIRAIQSLSSLRQISRFESRPPDILIDTKVRENSAEITRFLQTQFPKSFLLAFSNKENAQSISTLQFHREVRTYHIYHRFEATCFLEKLAQLCSMVDSKNAIHYRDLTLNLKDHSVFCHSTDEALALSKKEQSLLQIFFEQPKTCVTRKTLQDSVWKNETVSKRTIDSHISRLRKLLSPFCVSIINSYGGGYTLE